MAVDTDLEGKALCWEDDVSMALSDGDGLQWDDASQQFVPGGGGGGGTLITYADGNPAGGVDRQVQIRDDEAVPPHAAGPTNRGFWQREGATWLRVAPRYLHGDNHATGGVDPIQPADIGAAPIASPVFTGDPLAPTPAVDDNDTSIATTGFVAGQASSVIPLMDAAVAVIGTSLRYSRQDHVHPTDTSRAPLASPTFTGTPAGPTAAVDTNTTQLATTAFVLAQASSATPIMDGTGAVGTSTRYARADHVHPTDTSRAPLASPTFTGTPAAPTAAVDTNTTQLATTAFVLAQASASGDGTPAMDGTAARGTSTHYARADHVHPTDTSRAALASPALTGTPTAPTAAVDTNTTQIATTAFVLAQAAAATPLMDGTAAVGTSTRYARADHVHPTDTSRAPLASPTFTGTPAAPTAAVDTNTTQIATTAYVVGQGYAKLASPTFTGTPAAPTAAVDTNTTQLATTAFVLAQAASATPNMDGTAAVGTSTRYARADHIHASDTSRLQTLNTGAKSKMGTATVTWGGGTPNASIAIAHGLSATPTWIFCFAINLSGPIPIVASRSLTPAPDGTNMTIAARPIDNSSPANGTTTTIYWLAAV